jgi:uncharacterized protein YgiM (DUF1202 family)
MGEKKRYIRIQESMTTQQLQPFWHGTLIITKQLASTIAITKHPYLHGAGQNYKSIDCHSNTYPQLKFKMPAGHKVLGRSGSGRDSAVRIGFNGMKVELLFAHAKYENGYVISTWHHFHLSACIGSPRTYYDVTEFFDRKTCKISVPYWTNVQRNVNGDIITPNISEEKFEMVTLQKNRSIITTNTAEMNVRDNPSTKATSLGKIAPSSKYEVSIFADGEKVKDSSTWYQIPFGDKKGWINGTYVQEIDEKDCTTEIEKVNELEKKVNDMEKTYQALFQKQNAEIEKLLKEREDMMNKINIMTQKNDKLAKELQECKASIPNTSDTLLIRLIKFLFPNYGK